MKRFLCFFLGFAMMLGLFGCGKADTSSTTESATQSTQSTTMSKTESTASKGFDREMYIENLKKSDIFKEYSADDWRSHAYDYKLIALTFDDGPSYATVEESEVVVRIIETISQYEGKGTFFFTGRSLEKNGFEVPRYVLNNDFEVANHSYNHSSLSDADYETAVHEIADVNDMYEQNLGIRPKYFRG
ncbi:MAG: polysaccharide deacetylase family protein, partial [Clostridia bacterium]|nr:polysaccharide deacetylase family protein [Clostridia bacterium]